MGIAIKLGKVILRTLALPFVILVVIAYWLGWLNRKLFPIFLDGSWRGAYDLIRKLLRSELSFSFGWLLKFIFLAALPPVIVFVAFGFINAEGWSIWPLVVVLVISAAFPYHRWLQQALKSSASVLGWWPLAVWLGAGLLLLAYSPLELQQLPPILIDILPVIGVCSITIGALLMLSSADIKSLLAYYLTSHSGLIVLALSTGNGAVIEAAQNSTVGAGLIAVIVLLLSHNLQKRQLPLSFDNLSGLIYQTPKLAAIATLVLYTMPGLPGSPVYYVNDKLLTHFAGDQVYIVIIVLRVLVVCLAVGWTFQRMFLGHYAISGDRAHSPTQDLSKIEMVPHLLLALILIFLTMAPALGWI